MPGVVRKPPCSELRLELYGGCWPAPRPLAYTWWAPGSMLGVSGHGAVQRRWQEPDTRSERVVAIRRADRMPVMRAHSTRSSSDAVPCLHADGVLDCRPDHCITRGMQDESTRGSRARRACRSDARLLRVKRRRTVRRTAKCRVAGGGRVVGAALVLTRCCVFGQGQLVSRREQLWRDRFAD